MAEILDQMYPAPDQTKLGSTREQFLSYICVAALLANPSVTKKLPDPGELAALIQAVIDVVAGELGEVG